MIVVTPTLFKETQEGPQSFKHPKVPSKQTTKENPPFDVPSFGQGLKDERTCVFSSVLYNLQIFKNQVKKP